jgi:hypothetical protein
MSFSTSFLFVATCELQTSRATDAYFASNQKHEKKDEGPILWCPPLRGLERLNEKNKKIRRLKRNCKEDVK